MIDKFNINKFNSVIHTTARDEDLIINEWIVHNILLGFEHIYIYDDNSIIPISETIKILPNFIQEKLTIYRLSFDKFEEEAIKNTEYMEYYKSEIIENKQIFIVKYFISRHKHLINWCLFCDVDEFIYLRDHENINNFLKNYENETNLLIPWLLYGTSFIINNIYSDYLVMDYNRYHNDNYTPKISCHVKSFANFNKPINPKNFHWISDENYSFDRNKSPYELPIHINHYQKIDVKTFLRRKLRQDFGQKNGNRRGNKHLFTMLLEDNVSNNNFDKMEKYIHNIAKILNKKILNYDLDLNKDLKLCPTTLYSKNRLLSIGNNITYDLLRDLLNDENLRYAYNDEISLNSINNKISDEIDQNLPNEIDQNLPKDFDVNIYKELYPHLQNLNDMEIKKHYYNVGIKKNFPYKLDISNLPKDFDVKMYKMLNPNLSTLNDTKATQHYINHGINEKRHYKYDNSKLPQDFDLNMYKELNTDLLKLNDEQAKLHYINHGINEGRFYKIDISKLPQDFDVEMYKELNTDLSKLNDNQAKLHYINSGINEGRIYVPKSSTNDMIIEDNINNRLIEYGDVYGDKIKNYPNNDITYRYEFMVKYYNRLINSYIKINNINKEIINDINFSYPNINYDLLEIIDIGSISGMNESLNVDLLKVYDSFFNKIKYVMYPFLTYPTIDRRKYIFNYTNENKIYDYNIINLDHRHDNLNQVFNNIKNIKWLNPIRFNAIKHEKGFIGCLSSFISILKPYVDKNENVLIIEDDNIIIDNLKLNKILNILDNDLFQWDIFLGTFANLPIKLKSLIYVNDIEFLNVVNSTKANFVYLNKNIIKKVIELETNLPKIKSRLKYIDRYLNLFNIFTSYNICNVNNPKSEIEIIFNSENEKLEIEYTTIQLKNDELLYNTIYDKLPIEFNSIIYKLLNPDLSSYTDINAKLHYINHGITENRQYKDIHFDAQYFSNKYNIDSNLYLKYISDIRQLKNSYFTDDVNKHSVNSEYKYIFLVNHDYCLFGANHYMYLLFNILIKKFENTNIKPLLCEVKYNPQLLIKYSICQNHVIEYKNDPTLLYMLYEHFQPKLVYLNSCNFAIFNVYKYIPKDMTIVHSHEIFDHYLLAKINVPNFVVSHRIAQEYNTYYKNDNNFVIPLVQPPFLSNIDEILTLSDENIDVISNDFGIIDMSKITIGMCGQITDRKNYQLFIEVSKHYPHYNFIWIGDNNNVFTQYNNIYYITHTNNPYKYYKQVIDYFILFSHQDPCPYVILENILLETQIITFAKNIYTEHKSDLINDFYFEYPNEINLNNCIDAVNKFVKNTKQILKINKSNKGQEYIDKYFSFPHNIYQKIENILNN
jgi:hypothetical protein